MDTILTLIAMGLSAAWMIASTILGAAWSIGEGFGNFVELIAGEGAGTAASIVGFILAIGAMVAAGAAGLNITREAAKEAAVWTLERILEGRNSAKRPRSKKGYGSTNEHSAHESWEEVAPGGNGTRSNEQSWEDTGGARPFGETEEQFHEEEAYDADEWERMWESEEVEAKPRETGSRQNAIARLEGETDWRILSDPQESQTRRQAAYRRLMNKYHPDKMRPMASPEGIEGANICAQRIASQWARGKR